jgi:hypothetical protein
VRENLVRSLALLKVAAGLGAWLATELAVGIALNELQVTLGLDAWLATELAVSLTLLEVAAGLSAGLPSELTVSVTLDNFEAVWMLVYVEVGEGGEETPYVLASGTAAP